MRRCAVNHSSHAFSLIELTLVLLIIAVAAGVAVMRFQSPLRRADRQDVVRQVSDFDRLSRTIAREHDRPLRLVIDIGRNALMRLSNDGAADGSELAFGGSWRLLAAATPGGVEYGGTIEIPVSSHGLSTSYAICMEGQDRRPVWLLVAGLTGEVVQLQDERQVRDTFSALGGTDAG